MDVIRDKVNKKIISALRQEIIPWHNNNGAYANFMRKQKYNGINVLLLGLSSQERGFKNKWWGSASQIKMLDFDLKPRSPGTEIVIYKKGFFGTKLSLNSAYNLDQVMGDLYCWSPSKQTPRYKDMERIIKASGVEIKTMGDKTAYYRYPPLDWIEIPPKQMFVKGRGGINSYYETIAHELMHWTEIKLGWENDANKYPLAMRELRAEMGSCILLTELGIPHSGIMMNYRQFVGEWIDRMQKNSALIFKVSVSACKAVDYFLDLIRSNTKRLNYIEERVA